MKLLNKKFICILTLIIIIGNFIIPFLIRSSSTTPAIDDPMKNDIQSENPDTFQLCNQDKPNSQYLNPSKMRSSQIVDHYIVDKDKTRSIIEDRIVGNLTVRDNAILIIDNCTFEVRGKFNVIGNSQVIIKNATLNVVPGELGVQEIVVNFKDNSKIRMEYSQIFTYPQPTPTNISYLLSDDYSQVTIVNCILNFKIPRVLHMDVSLSPANAGTFVLTGNTIWNVKNSKIDGILKIVNNDLQSRWFLFTQLQNAKFFMINSTGFMNDNSQPFIKPVAGYLELIDSRIPIGVIDVEVVAEFYAVNLTISELNLRDQTKTRLINSEISNNLDVGSIAITPSAAGGTDEPEETCNKPKSKLYFEDSTIGGTLIAQGNSSSEIINSKIDRCTIFSEAFVHFDESTVMTIFNGLGNSTINIENTSVPNLNLADNCKLVIFQNPKIGHINKVIMFFNSQCSLTMYSTKINYLEIFAGDKIPPEEYGLGYEPDKNISRISINMIDSSILEIKTEDDSIIDLTLRNSKIDGFKFKRFKDESTKISILDLGSNFTLPKVWPDINLEFFIYHKIKFRTLVNSQPITANIVVTDSANENIVTTSTDSQGERNLKLLYQKYTKNGEIPSGEYNINLTYLGFNKIIKTKAEINDNFKISWEDHNPPSVDNIKINTDYQRTKRGTRITAIIKDDDVKVIANATIYYQHKTEDKWSAWKNEPMTEIDNNTFEAEIPQLQQRTQVRFFIISYDVLDNKEVSDKYEYTIPNTEEILVYSIVTIFIVFIILALVALLHKRRKVKKYMKKSPNIVARVDEKKNSDHSN
jgi:hypothetical protein